MKQKKILLVKNNSLECPGIVKDILKEKNICFDMIDLDNGDKFPDARNYAAVFVFGGPDSANDQTPKMKEELKRINETLDAGIPYFGVCLGMQTLVKAAAGEVYKNAMKEVGWKDPEGNYFEMELTNEGKKDLIFKGIKQRLKIFHLHGETVALKNGMRLLATGKFCINQVVKVGNNAYGFQGHIELTDSLLEKWIKNDSDLRLLDTNSLRMDFKNIKSEYETNRRKILTNFLQIVGLS